MVKKLSESLEKLMEETNEVLKDDIKKLKVIKNNSKKATNKISNDCYQKINNDVEIKQIKTKRNKCIIM